MLYSLGSHVHSNTSSALLIHELLNQSDDPIRMAREWDLHAFLSGVR
jgi:hypothetical protein